jgi:hypothetical protein
MQLSLLFHFFFFYNIPSGVVRQESLTIMTLSDNNGMYICRDTIKKSVSCEIFEQNLLSSTHPLGRRNFILRRKQANLGLRWSCICKQNKHTHDVMPNKA